MNTLEVEYLSSFKAEKMFDNYSPTISLNKFWDNRPEKNYIGKGYGTYGKERSYEMIKEPTEIIENALVMQLENVGFEVVKVTGWNLDSDDIPSYIDSDLIMGGKLQAFWVISQLGMLTKMEIDSTVSFDLIIADVDNNKVIWAG